MKNPIASKLILRALELQVNLGWSTLERTQKQIVALDAVIEFSLPPKACETDHIDDTVCYDQLIQLIKKNISSREFHLLEHLGQQIYQTIKQAFSTSTHVSVSITKKPAILNLTGGVSFIYEG